MPTLLIIGVLAIRQRINILESDAPHEIAHSPIGGEVDLSGLQRKLPLQQIDEQALPCAIGSDQTVKLTLFNRQIQLRHGLKTSGTQTLPAVPLLALIALVATTWMLSGLVPTFIHYGLKVLNPTFFLVITCVVCALVSVLTGSSWTTIATMGVAFIGIGTAMGYSPGWVAGAIISGAYFGDKISPLSDTTVVASSSVGVELFTHIRYMLITTVPSLIIALGVFTVAGVCSSHSVVDADPELHRTRRSTSRPGCWSSPSSRWHL